MNTQSAAEQRAQLENWLNYLLNLLNRFETLDQQKRAISQQYQHDMPMSKKWGIWAIVLWAAGLTLAAFTFFSRLTGIVVSIVLFPFSNVEYGDPLEGLVRVLMWVTPIMLSVGLAILIVFLRNKIWLPKQHAKAKYLTEQRHQHNAHIRAQEQTIDQQLDQARHDFRAYIGNQFPPDYLHIEAVSFCANRVRNQFADTLKEAINQYDEMLYKQRMEDMASAQLREQTRAANAAQFGNMINAAGHTANYLETRNISRNFPPRRR